MLAHAQEIDQTLDLIREAKRQLDDAGRIRPERAHRRDDRIPAAAIALPLFLKRFDFLSIGTNDLIQHARDRPCGQCGRAPVRPASGGAAPDRLYVARSEARGRVRVGVRGNGGGPGAHAPVARDGATEFSMHPSQLLVVKQEILRAHLKALEKPTADVLAAFEPEEVQAALQRLSVASRARMRLRVGVRVAANRSEVSPRMRRPAHAVASCRLPHRGSRPGARFSSSSIPSAANRASSAAR